MGTRAVPLGTVADHAACTSGTSVSAVKSVCEAKGLCHDADVMIQDGHVLFHDHNKGSYELMVVKKPKVLGQSTFTMSKALSSAGVPAAITGIGARSQVRYMSSNVPAPHGPAPRDLAGLEHKLHNDMEVPSFDDYRRSSTKDPTKKADDTARKTFTYSITACRHCGHIHCYETMRIVAS